jgi:DNA-binding Xre family transcriptional regulator
MIYIKLREAMEAYRNRTGVRLTYEVIAEQTGISVPTLQSLAARPGYNTRLSTVERLCRVFECEVSDLLVLREGTTEVPEPDDEN